MPPKRKPARMYAEAEEWFPARDTNGQWVVVNGRGEQVLRSPDPRIRLEAVHLAASAPLLRSLLDAVARRLQSYLQDHGYAYSRDARLAAEAMMIVGSTVPPMELYMPALSSTQHELHLDGGGEPERVAGYVTRRGRGRVG